jgi:catechol 2,3-dioxygenase-like lactoylglutathione lyase family enzyme
MIATEIADQAMPKDDSLADSATDPTCYSLTLFTQRWREIRDFYVDIIGAKVLSERAGRYCEMILGGVPICIRACEFGETVSYFHLYLSLKNRTPVLTELRKRGIIVTNVGPYINFRDPEGRVIKLSEAKTLVL